MREEAPKMEKRVLISQAAQNLVSRILESCSVERPGGLACTVVPGGGTIRDFARRSGLKPGAVEALSQLSGQMGKEEIDLETVCVFFGGEKHLRDCLENLKGLGLGREAEGLLVLSHLLVPVRLLENSSAICEAGVVFRDVENDTSARPGEMVLVHLGMVVMQDVPKDTLEKLQSIQRDSPDIQELLGAVKEGIDCAKIAPLFEAIGKMQRAG